MALISVPAIYDGEQVRLMERAPVQGPYRVLVTFVEPVLEQARPGALTSFEATFGTWQDDRPLEETLRDIHRSRRSKTVPPGV